MGDGQVTVSLDTLRGTGQAIVDTADALRRQVGTLVGDQEGDADANRSFSTATAEAACASGWERALSVLGADLAVAGDNLTLNAANYATTEGANTARLAVK